MGRLAGSVGAGGFLELEGPWGREGDAQSGGVLVRVGNILVRTGG